MQDRQKPYNIPQLASAVFMILALLWLTISLPFVYDFQQKQAIENNTAKADQGAPATSEEESNPFGNTTEEKNPSNGTTLSEEYLHDLHIHDHFFIIDKQSYKCEETGTYTAYHGEVQVPPPNTII